MQERPNMLRIEPLQLAKHLRELGVETGDHLFVHSEITSLGWPVGGVGMYRDVLLDLLGPQGTLAVPTFTFGFCRGALYDADETPSVGMGVLAELIRKTPGARRSRHPIQSMAVIGHYAELLAAIDTPSAYATGSAFGSLAHLGFKLLLLGANPRSVSLVHHCEEVAGVPYRYWKAFTGLVRFESQPRQAAYQMYVRDLAMDPDVNETHIADQLRARARWQEISVNYGTLSLCAAADYVQQGLMMLQADAFSLLDNPEHVRLALSTR